MKNIKIVFNKLIITACYYTASVSNSVALFLLPWMSHVTTTIIPLANVGISVALKVILMHLQTITRRGILYSIFQGKKCVLWCTQYGILKPHACQFYRKSSTCKCVTLFLVNFFNCPLLIYSLSEILLCSYSFQRMSRLLCHISGNEIYFIIFQIEIMSQGRKKCIQIYLFILKVLINHNSKDKSAP
jgi:hypothetical protein